MRIAIFSDLHANGAALSALDDSVDELWFLGDIVGYGPDVAEAIDFVHRHATIALRGNHDNAAVTDDPIGCSPANKPLALATREATRTAGGFRRYHAHLVSRQADALGTAIILKDVLTNDLREIDGGVFDHPATTSNPLNFLLQQTPPEASVRDDIQCPPCPICDTERTLEDMAMNAFLHALSDPAAMETFSRSDGLCVPHFRLVFQRAKNDGVWSKILETEKRALKDLTGQLSELARKHDYRFKDELQGEEMKSCGERSTLRWAG